MLTKLWITFLLSKSYVGNVGYVGYRLKSVRLHTTRAIWGVIAI